MRADVYKSTQIKADNLAPGQVGPNFVTLGSGVLSRVMTCRALSGRSSRTPTSVGAGLPAIAA